MTVRNTKIISIFLAVLVAIGSAAFPADAKKRSKSGKAKTTAVQSKKKSSKSKSKSNSSRKRSTRKRSSSGGSSSWAQTYNNASAYTQGGAAPPDRAVQRTGGSTYHGTTVSSAKPESKRKIVVEKPELEKIKRETLDPNSKFYFPKLKAKYEVNDTTMTPEEFRNFYLGYMFQEDFDPYRISPYSNVTDELRMKATHTKEEIDTITKYALLSLEDNPFDLRQMSFLVHVLKEKRKDMRAKIWEYRLENLLGAIKGTGTGESTENAWYVIYPVHEYDMVQLLGYEATDADFIEPGYDYLSVVPDESDTRRRDKSAKGFYFNVMIPQQQYELKHPEEIEEEVVDEELPAFQLPANSDDIPAE